MVKNNLLAIKKKKKCKKEYNVKKKLRVTSEGDLCLLKISFEFLI